MIGVTFFGVFLTPMFYTAIRYLTDHQSFPTERPLRSVPTYAASEDRRVVEGAHR
jgi:hypothetical protein